MILEQLQSWTGKISVNDTEYNSVLDAQNALKNQSFDFMHISLIPLKNAEIKHANSVLNVSDTVYCITVKSYMRKHSTPEFDLMARWNNDIPMPLLTMVGIVLQETKGMVKMQLHGDLVSQVTQTCMCCGKPITNKISQYFGMGPICGQHDYTNPFETIEELNDAINNYRSQYLQKITWTGWIPKSAIIDSFEVEK